MDIHSENELPKWTAAECPFTIEYSAQVLDDIRLAVTDAFFSLPRGGAEIGGILLGRQENGRVTIIDSMAMECEHAFGPSFVLSPRDQSKLADLVAAAGKNPNSSPVGWFHSHTRSEIFLSEADQEIHKRFFPEPCQVALVLKPHTFQPMRAGFFFWEEDGSIHATASYREFVLDPLPMRPIPAGSPGPAASPLPGARERETNGPVIDIASVTAQEPQPAVAVPVREPEAPRPEVPAPNFLAAQAAPSRRWVGWAAAAIGVALGVAGYQTREAWLPRVQGMFRPAAPQSLSLYTIEQDGQLQVRWNGDAPAAHTATAGSLLIVDGAANPFSVPLDSPHLQSGAFTYARQSERVDVTLILTQPGGREVRQATLFTGNPPPPRPAPAAATVDDSALRTERDALAAQNAALKADFGKQVERTKRLEKAVDDLRKVVQREQQRRRLEHQAPDTAK